MQRIATVSFHWRNKASTWSLAWWLAEARAAWGTHRLSRARRLCLCGNLWRWGLSCLTICWLKLQLAQKMSKIFMLSIARRFAFNLPHCRPLHLQTLVGCLFSTARMTLPWCSWRMPKERCWVWLRSTHRMIISRRGSAYLIPVSPAASLWLFDFVCLGSQNALMFEKGTWLIKLQVFWIFSTPFHLSCDSVRSLFVSHVSAHARSTSLWLQKNM